jgi:hypothetical protein
MPAYDGVKPIAYFLTESMYLLQPILIVCIGIGLVQTRFPEFFDVINGFQLQRKFEIAQFFDFKVNGSFLLLD